MQKSVVSERKVDETLPFQLLPPTQGLDLIPEKIKRINDKQFWLYCIWQVSYGNSNADEPRGCSHATNDQNAPWNRCD